MAATSFQQVTAMLVELNPQIFKKEVFCISSKGFNRRDAYRVMLRKYPDVMNIEQMCDALRISTKTGNKRRAEAMTRELQDDFEPPVDPNGPPSKAIAVCGLSGAMAGNRKVNRQADNLRQLQRTVE